MFQNAYILEQLRIFWEKKYFGQFLIGGGRAGICMSLLGQGQLCEYSNFLKLPVLVAVVPAENIPLGYIAAVGRSFLAMEKKKHY